MKLLIVDDEKHVVHGLLQMVPWKELGFTDVERLRMTERPGVRW